MIDSMLHADKYIELNLQECGKEKCISEKIFTFTPKTYYLFHYIISGKGYFEIDGKRYNLKKGMIFYIPPTVRAHYYPDKNDPWTYIWLGFAGSNAQEFLNLAGVKLTTPIFVDNSDYRLRILIESIYDRYSDIGYLDLKCLGYAYQLFNEMIRLFDKTETGLTFKEQHVNEAKDFIMNNYQFDITITDIANSVGVTSNYLANIFNEVIKISPKQLLTQTRMDKACLLLQIEKYKVKEVGEMVGYKNQLHFSSEFKKSKGMSPLTYRRKQLL